MEQQNRNFFEKKDNMKLAETIKNGTRGLAVTLTPRSEMRTCPHLYLQTA
jgi:hypothetical protein